MMAMVGIMVNGRGRAYPMIFHLDEGISISILAGNFLSLVDKRNCSFFFSPPPSSAFSCYTLLRVRIDRSSSMSWLLLGLYYNPQDIDFVFVAVVKQNIRSPGKMFEWHTPHGTEYLLMVH